LRAAQKVNIIVPRQRTGRIGRSLQDQIAEQQTAITRQTSQVDSLSHENERLKDTLNVTSQRIDELEKELKRSAKTIETSQGQADSAHEQNRELKKQIQTLNQQVQSLNGQLQESQTAESDATTQIAKLEAAIKKLKQQNQDSNASLTGQSQAMTLLAQEKDELARDAKRLESERESLARENAELKLILNEVKATVPGRSRSLGELPAVLKRLNAENQKLLSAIGVKESDEADAAIARLQEKGRVLDEIGQVFGLSDFSELPAAIRRVRSDQGRQKQEHQRILAMLRAEGTADLGATVSALVEKQKQLDGQLELAADFLSQLLAIISGGTASLLRLTFPMRPTMRDRLVDIFKKMKNQATLDRQQVEQILERAKALGYQGDDCMEACDFLANHIAEGQKQGTLEQVNQELSAVRAASEKRQEEHSRERAALKKRIADLRAAIARQQGSGAQREEELTEQIRNLEKKIRELTEALGTERRVREELGRIGAGYSADSKYLRSKMTANELRLLTLVERIMQQERESQELREKQRAIRKALLGDPLARSQGRT
jgi:chromosome segregation ATPase